MRVAQLHVAVAAMSSCLCFFFPHQLHHQYRHLHWLPEEPESGTCSPFWPNFLVIHAGYRQVYMGVAADCEYTSRYTTPENATTQILTVWNSASALYKV